jgi:predicted nucleic-acid-binding Zn-ribbon protein
MLDWGEQTFKVASLYSLRLIEHPKFMKKKGIDARPKFAGNTAIMCRTCGNTEFSRSLSEIDSIVQLAFAKGASAIKETIIREGKIEFTYRCIKCGVTMFDSTKDSGGSR